MEVQAGRKTRRHLEIVNPVVEGKTRARQRIRGDNEERRKVLALLIHGDAALAGQGIVAETLNFSQLPGYKTGGTVHIVINNQIGFTTDPRDARSTRYCTDVAKMIEAPIFHVNGDDPEAMCMVCQLALDFRVRWKRDVFIDMYCFRRHGHNESDEPTFTQPMLYRTIAAHPQVSTIYTEELVAEGSITAAQGDAIKEEYSASLEANLAKAKAREASKAAKRTGPGDVFKGSTAEFQPEYHHTPVQTSIPAEEIDGLARGLTTIPATFKINPKIRRLLDARIQAHKDGGPVDWGFGEALAFGSLLIEGTPVRLSGQDCERGTFSHRHAVLADIDTGEKYTPLKNLDPKQARFCVYNSLLSEAAVLGFDYGYSLDYPEMLCLWEAQFGDFANGAQVVIDQFIVSGESKWQRTCGIVLLLPHGYEGQGPEHSSARLERFLQSSAEEDIQVANVTTPAQYFHLLRRQVRRDFRKPLIIMSPKSLLRHPGAVSRISDFTSGGLPGRSSRIRQRPPSAGARDPLLREDLLRPLRTPRQERDQGRGDRPGRAALSPPQGPPRRDRGADARGAARLVPGGVPEHGRLVVDLPADRRHIRQGADLRGPRRLGVARGRLARAPQDRARRRARGCLFTLIMAIDVKIPPMGESISSGILAKWHVKNGDAVKKDQPLFELETDKITSEGTAEAAGTITLKVEAGTEVKIGQVVASIEAGGAAAPPAAPAAAPKGGCPRGPACGGGSVSQLSAGSPVKRDVQSRRRRRHRQSRARHREGDMLARRRRAPLSRRSRAGAAPPRPRLLRPPRPRNAARTRKKMTPLRQKIAERLVSAQHSAALLTTFNEVDMSAVMALRAKHQEEFVKKNGLKLGFMSFFVKAVVHALKAVPSINSQIDGDSLVQNHFYDIGVAVSTEKGLMVPVIRNCDTLGMASIERSITDAAGKAREGKITLADLEGGVFTITNGGTFGSLLSTPIINPPQSAILGMHAINERPVAVAGQVVIRPMMYIALTYDHRLVDGREAVTFLVKVKQGIEDPARLLLGI